MRKRLTRTEQLGITAELDQVEAAIEASGHWLDAEDEKLLKRFEAVSAAVTPLLYERHGAELVYAFVRSGAYSLALEDWYDRFADDPTDDVETHYQFMSAYMPEV